MCGVCTCTLRHHISGVCLVCINHHPMLQPSQTTCAYTLSSLSVTYTHTQGADDPDSLLFRIPKKPTTMSENGELDRQDDDEAAAAAGGGGGGSDDDEWEEVDEDEEEDGLPSYEFRFECAKMLLELDDSTETAIQVSD